MKSARLTAYLYLLGACFIWGIAGIVIKLTVSEIEPFPFLLYRFAISALFSLPFLVHKKLLNNPKDLFLLLAYCLTSTTLGLGFLFLGIEKTTVLNLSLLTLAAPLIVEVAGVIFLGEKLTKREKIGTAIAFLGAIFTIVEPMLAMNNGKAEILGNVFIVIYMLIDIAGVILLKKLLKKNYNPATVTHLSFVVGFLTAVPLTLLFHTPNQIIFEITSLSLPYHAGVVYMALFSGTIAYLLRARAQKTIVVGEAAIFGYLVPIFTAVLALIILHETLTPLFIVGGVIIATGVFIAETR